MMRRGLFVLGGALVASMVGILGVGAGCGGTDRVAGDSSAPVPIPDAAGDVADASDASSEPPPDDPCGEPAGTAARAPWPMVGACARRVSSRKDLRGPSTGAVSFTFATTGRATSPVVAEDGTIVFGTADAHLVAISPSGEKRWDVPVAGPVIDAPVLTSGGEVTFATSSGRLIAIALSTGIELLAKDGAQGPSALLPLADGTLVYTASDGKMHKVDRADLTEKSAIDVNSIEPLTQARDGALLASGRDGALRRIAKDGAVSELFRAGSALLFAPIVTAYGDVIVVGQDAKLRSLDGSGRLRFERPLGGAPRGTPAAALDGSVYVATVNGKVVGLDRDGKELFAFAPLGLAEAPIVAGSGTVFFGAEDTKLYALQPSGRLLFSGSLRSKAVSAGAFGASGALYLATEGGVVGVGP